MSRSSRGDDCSDIATSSPPSSVLNLLASVFSAERRCELFNQATPGVAFRWPLTGNAGVTLTVSVPGGGHDTVVHSSCQLSRTLRVKGATRQPGPYRGTHTSILESVTVFCAQAVKSSESVYCARARLDRKSAHERPIAVYIPKVEPFLGSGWLRL